MAPSYANSTLSGKIAGGRALCSSEENGMVRGREKLYFEIVRKMRRPELLVYKKGWSADRLRGRETRSH